MNDKHLGIIVFSKVMIRMKSELDLNTLLVILVILYFPSMMISNMIALKINYIVAMIAFSIAFYFACKNKKNLLILCSLLIMIFIKVMTLGFYGLRPLMITVLGSILVISFTESFEKIGVDKKERCIKFIIGFSFSVCLIIIFQKLNILPVSIGKMKFLNTAGYNIFGEYESSYRVSSYFYHPYDTALAILPLLVVLLRNPWHKAIIPVFLISIVLLMLGLKILIVFSLAFMLLNQRMANFSGVGHVFALIFLLTALVMIIPFADLSSESISFSAGRLLIWKIMIIEWFEKSTLMNILMGLNFDILSRSLMWAPDESYTPHNQFLYNVVYLGVIFCFYFWYLFYKVLLISSNLNVFIILMMLTFCNTGDLFSFLGFWVSLSLVYATLSKETSAKESYLKVADPA